MSALAACAGFDAVCGSSLAEMDFGLGPNDLKIWFGILTLIVVELGLITPPVGMNVFVINSLARDVPMSRTFIGVAPFFVAELLRIALRMAFPALTLWLPGLNRATANP